jgi:hypothetical protein
MTNHGFVVDGSPGNRGSGATTSVIEYNPSQAAAARTLAAVIPGATLKENAQLGADVELVLGSSYLGAGNAQPSASTPAGTVTGGGTTAATASCPN